MLSMTLGHINRFKIRKWFRWIVYIKMLVAVAKTRALGKLGSIGATHYSGNNYSSH